MKEKLKAVSPASAFILHLSSLLFVLYG